jgi:hypothetical protein
LKGSGVQGSEVKKISNRRSSKVGFAFASLVAQFFINLIEYNQPLNSWPRPGMSGLGDGKPDP